MSCTTTSLTTQWQEEPALDHDRSLARRQTARKRRHSSYHVRHCSADSENVQLLVDEFLDELGRRLDFLESCGQLKLDAGIEMAYATLQRVRDSCSHVSDSVIDAGRRRANLMVEILDERYKDALAKKSTLEQKVAEGVRLMEALLSEFETRAYALRDAGLGSVAQDFIDSGMRQIDIGFGKAKDVVDGGIGRARRATNSMKEGIEIAVALALERAREHGLITYEDLPAPWRINPYITRGYRFYETKFDCIRSALTFSNESFNIWSHAIGLLIVLSIAFHFYPTSVNFALSTKSDIFIAAVFFFAACKCLVCSTMWHTMNSIAEQNLMERFACVDYTGISLLVAASIMTTEYTAFYCEPVARWFYMFTTALLGIGGVVLPWHPTFNRIDMAWARVAFYVSLATTGAVPMIHIAMTRGLPWAFYFYFPIAKSLFVYIAGALLYAAKIPERWCPGAFDYVGGSHNIWHLAVLTGILFHYCAMQEFFASAFARARSGGGDCTFYY